MPAIDPLVVKASAGVAFRAPVLRAGTAEEGCAALRDGRVRGATGWTRAGPRCWTRELPERVALVLGNETDGLSDAVRAELDGLLAIPMHGGVESLNVASAGAVAAFELPAAALTRVPPDGNPRPPPRARGRRRSEAAWAPRVGGMVQRRLPRPAELRAAAAARPVRPRRRPTRRLQRAASIADLRAIARRRTPRAVFDYTDGAADGELSLSRARAAFARVEFHPTVLRDVSDVDTSRDILGRRASAAVRVRPHRLHPDDAHRGRARRWRRWPQEVGIPYTLSTMGTTTIEDVAAAAPDARKWFQLYLWRDRAPAKDLVQRAADAGYDTLMLTVDTPVGGARLRDVRNGLTDPARAVAAHVRRRRHAPATGGSTCSPPSR